MRSLHHLALVALVAFSGALAGCGGAQDESGTQGTSGSGGSAEGGSSGSGGSGTSGKAGSAGSGTAGSGTAGSGTAGSGTAGSGQAGSGTAGSGTAGSGTAGSGTAGSGTAGSGTAGSGTAGSGTAGSGASAGTGGSGGSGQSGAAGSGASAGSGQGECKPGEMQMSPDGCNTCSCTPDGMWACTDKACPPECTGGPPPCAAPPEGCSYQGAGCVNGQWTCGELTCGNQCKPGEVQVAPDGCNTCSCTPDGTWVCTDKACVSECQGDPPPCAAPPEGCDYVGGGCVNSQWTCGELVCNNQCKADSDCPLIKMACQQCPDGSPTCPSSACLDGTCQIVWSACGGGGVGPGLSCDKPGAEAPADDGCNTCICGDNLTWACTKIACVECDGPPPPCAAPPEGCDYVGGGCVNGQWTCGELVCNNQCKADSDCPQPGAPCQQCADGTFACPSVSCIGGQCVGSFETCPPVNPCAPQDASGNGLCDAFFGYAWNGQECTGVSGCQCVGNDCDALFKTPDECKNAHLDCGGSGLQCKADSDCPAIKMPCQSCPDGSANCPSSQCVGNQCAIVWSGCGGTNSCAAQSIKGVGDCKKLLGFAWDGKSCNSVNGCECAGDCAAMFTTQEECDKTFAACQ